MPLLNAFFGFMNSGRIQHNISQKTEKILWKGP